MPLETKRATLRKSGAKSESGLLNPEVANQKPSKGINNRLLWYGFPSQSETPMGCKLSLQQTAAPGLIGAVCAVLLLFAASAH